MGLPPCVDRGSSSLLLTTGCSQGPYAMPSSIAAGICRASELLHMCMHVAETPVQGCLRQQGQAEQLRRRRSTSCCMYACVWTRLQQKAPWVGRRGRAAVQAQKYKLPLAKLDMRCWTGPDNDIPLPGPVRGCLQHFANSTSKALHAELGLVRPEFAASLKERAEVGSPELAMWERACICAQVLADSSARCSRAQYPCTW